MTEPINQLTLKDAAGLERFIGELSKAIVHGYNCPVTDDFSLRVQGQEAKVSSTIRAIYDDCFPIIRSELAKGGEVEKAVQKICELQDDYEAGEMTQDQFKDWVRSTLASALRPDTKYTKLVEAVEKAFGFLVDVDDMCKGEMSEFGYSEYVGVRDRLSTALSSPTKGAEYVVMYQERMWGRYMELAWAHRAVSHLKGAVIYRLVAVDAKDVTPR